jgi:hypothetical protein
MGTRFRTMLAPIGIPTGDGRRFATDAIEVAPTPFPLEWVRESRGGHDGAVVIGAVHESAISTVADAIKAGYVSDETVKSAGLDRKMLAVWASGELFDDADREDMPRLAEDVAEVLTLINSGVLGPSVDLDSFEGIPVKEGTDEELTWEDLDEAESAGEDVKIELLITQGRVRAATLVSIPAFMETSRPLSLDEPEADDTESVGKGTGLASLIASVAAPARPEVTAFDPPKLDGPTPIEIDFETGRVFGHIATWRTCHLGYADVCVTAPRDGTGGYAWFNRFPVETADGSTVWAGRLTVGGRHPVLSLTASATMAQYDGKTVAAYVRASEDAHGIVISGTLNPYLDDAQRRVLARRKVSGDWRETPSGLSLVEVLALAPGPRQHSEPGFPIAATHSRHGRQTALTASFGPDSETVFGRIESVDVAAEVRSALKAEREREGAANALTATLDAERDAAVAQFRKDLFDALKRTVE